MVGALLVSGVETVWSGEEIPPYGDTVTVKDYRGEDITLERFAEMARFNYGSTVIVLLPRGRGGAGDRADGGIAGHGWGTAGHAVTG